VELTQRIEEIILAPLADKGYELVRIQISGNTRRTLQVMIDRIDGQPINVDDCANASYQISVLLDVTNPISGAYVLEVSSPGLERPLVKIKDYQRFVGHEVVVKTVQAVGNRKTFQGKLESATETAITLLLNEHRSDELLALDIPYEDIRSAHLYVTF
jgi:ribosome maturation factor RimP